MSRNQTIVLWAAILLTVTWWSWWYWSRVPQVTFQPPGQQEVVKVGIIASLTGRGAERGESARQGLELALDEIKAKGLLRGQDIQLVYQDVPLDKAKQAPAAFQHLVEVEKVAAVIGPMGSNVALAVTPLVDGAKVPAIIHTASALSATENNEYVFRLWPTARNYADVIVPRLKDLGYTRVAALSAINDNTTDLRNVLKEKFTGTDLTLVADEQVASDAKDFRSQLAKIKSIGHDVFFLNLFEGQIGLAARQARELGVGGPLFSNAVLSAVELEPAGGALEGVWFPRFGGYDEATKQKFVGKFGKEPVNPESAAAAHEALLTLAQAMDSIGLEPAAIKDYLYKTQFHGSIGTWRFLPSGDAEVPINLQTVEGGQIVGFE